MGGFGLLNYCITCYDEPPTPLLSALDTDVDSAKGQDDGPSRLLYLCYCPNLTIFGDSSTSRWGFGQPRLHRYIDIDIRCGLMCVYFVLAATSPPNWTSAGHIIEIIVTSRWEVMD